MSSSATPYCAEFSQNAWRPDLCINCQRPRTEHPAKSSEITCSHAGFLNTIDKSSPQPNRRASGTKSLSGTTATTSKRSPHTCSILESSLLGQVELTNGIKQNAQSDTLKPTSLIQTSKLSIVSFSPELPKSILFRGKSRKGASTKGDFDSSKDKRVVFVDTVPDIIGYDGGLGNVTDDEEFEEPTLVSNVTFSLTDEEKYFALLALENTLWNSEAHNLLEETDSAKQQRKTVREFEDVNLESLCFSKHFQTLRDCDGVHRTHGTFPVRKRLITSKLDAGNLFKKSEISTVGDRDMGHGTNNFHIGSISILMLESDQEARSLSSSEELGMTTEKELTGYKGSVFEDKIDSYTLGDITDCLYATRQSSVANQHDASHSSADSEDGKKISNKTGPNTGQFSSSTATVKTKLKLSQQAAEINDYDSEGSTDPLNDSATVAGLQAIAFLNDVLATYGENESSTDDPEQLSTVQSVQELVSMKSLDFEARLASVAATLDLSKQQRGKRPAPRPPVSPPPEPYISPKRKTQNQQEPCFKMVTIGKAIMPLPSTQDISKSQHAGAVPGLFSLEDIADSEGRLNDSSRSKKGITSFLKTILRRGRESSESVESANPDIQFVADTDVRSEPQGRRRDSSEDHLIVDKVGLKSSPQSRIHLAESESSSIPDLDLSSQSSVDSDDKSLPQFSSSTQVNSKCLASPKQILKRTAAKFSPPTPHKASSQCKADNLVQVKPKPSPKNQEEIQDVMSNPVLAVHRRAKSPKRSAPPAPPVVACRSSLVTKLDSELARELEQRLARPSEMKSHLTTTQESQGKPEPQALKADSQTSLKSETRKSMTVPPPLPPPTSQSPSTSPVSEESRSFPSSPTVSECSHPDPFQEDEPHFVEKIELPTALPGKKGFLGKLSVNRKPRAPAPPAVKRARSISDADKQRGRKINAADISGPVLVTDVTNKAVLENRRNTISLGDDPASVTVAQTSESFDDLDLPVLSPLGSLENLYEAILPKTGGDSHRFHYYAPTSSSSTKMTLCPNIPAEGYLEPLPASNMMLNTTQAVTESVAEDIGTSGENNMLDKLSGSVEEGKLKMMGKISSSKPADNKAQAAKHVLEPEMTEQRQLLLASQPIYEEIPADGHETNGNMTDSKPGPPVVTQLIQDSQSLETQQIAPVKLVTALHHPKRKISEDSSQRHQSPSRSATTSNSLPQSQAALKQTSFVTPSPQCMTASMALVLPPVSTPMSSSFMMHSQPVNSKGELLPLPPLPQNAPRSLSKETISSESDTHSSSGTLSRPRPAPRRRPKRPDTAGSDQYVSMNRPNAQVTLGEAKLRETFARITNLNFQSLHDVYLQCERLLSLEKLSFPSTSQLKWADFDIYGQALHASGRCVVYNAKLRGNNSSCQLMVLHSRPAAEMSLSSHPSLLRPATVFADNVPFSFLTADFIKTSQLLQNSVYDSCLARCFVAVGMFDIAESLSAHLILLRETLIHDPDTYLRIVMTATLQLLSAMSHCLDRGFTVTETDLNDVFLVARQDLRGKVVAFLPHQRAPDVPQGEAMCGFLDHLLQEAIEEYCGPGEEEPTVETEEEVHLLSTVEKLRLSLQPRRLECLAQVRAIIEYLLWGPSKSALCPESSEADNPSVDGVEGVTGDAEVSSMEQDHSAWLERERTAMLGRLARSVSGLGAGISVEDFYRLKFLLKSSATSLTESLRQLS